MSDDVKTNDEEKPDRRAPQEGQTPPDRQDDSRQDGGEGTHDAGARPAPGWDTRLIARVLVYWVAISVIGQLIALPWSRPHRSNPDTIWLAVGEALWLMVALAGLGEFFARRRDLLWRARGFVAAGVLASGFLLFCCPQPGFPPEAALNLLTGLMLATTTADSLNLLWARVRRREAGPVPRWLRVAGILWAALGAFIIVGSVVNSIWIRHYLQHLQQ